MLYMLKSKKEKADKRRILKDHSKLEARKARASQATSERRVEVKEKKSKGEKVERRSIHLVLIARRTLAWRNTVGSGLIYNVELINSLVI